jgi:signal transduction histidine kinase
MLLPRFNGSSEEERKMMLTSVTRIQSIANDLLKQKKASQEARREVRVLLSDLLLKIKELQNEKKIQGQNFYLLNQSSENPESQPRLMADADSLLRIFSNFINNSFEAMPGDREPKIGIELVACPTPGKIRFIVRDNGNGIPESILKKLGKQEISYGKATSTQSGTGIGVYSAAQEIKTWGGTLEIQSTPGQGTVMIIDLAYES